MNAAMMVQPYTDRRLVRRTGLKHDALLFFKGQPGALSCWIADISPIGLRLHVPGLSVLPMTFEITFDNFATVQRCRLIWRRGELIGAMFDTNARKSP